MHKILAAAFQDELEKIAISGELAARALRGRLETVAESGGTALKSRTIRQASNISDEFARRASVARNAAEKNTRPGLAYPLAAKSQAAGMNATAGSGMKGAVRDLQDEQYRHIVNQQSRLSNMVGEGLASQKPAPYPLFQPSAAVPPPVAAVAQRPNLRLVS